jgi:iron complex outermembrane receptor protein
MGRAKARRDDLTAMQDRNREFKMPTQRSAGAARSLLFINALLLSTALALPAMAQIEEVVVTAQKRTEDVQSVPIAVTAFTGQDLKTQQINQFKDLQFHAPNVTYTNGDFGTPDFQIRGIGITAVGYDSESGVAINYDDVYLSNPNLTESSFFDLSGLEVLAGPQSTLYGRGATGGVVNVNIIKPDLEQMSAELVGTYGNYDTTKVEGAVNVPIVTDQLALRVAGEWDKRDGFVTNIYDNGNVDGLDQYSVRGTLRWQPMDGTTVDVTGQFSNEDDTHMRSDKQLCTTDPTGILGCLPTSAGTEPVNLNATLSTIASSQQGLTTLFGSQLGSLLGLYNLAVAPTLPPGYVDPSGDRQINTDFTPIWRSNDNFLSLKWQQHIVNWLDSTLIVGYDNNSYFSQESYNNIPGDPFPTNTNYALVAPGLTANCAASLGIIPGGPNLNCSEETFLGTISALAYGGSPAYEAKYAPFFAHPGELPISGVGNLGLIGGNYSFTPNAEAFDQSDGNSAETSAEWRFATSFAGPLNGMLGLYYLHTQTAGDYYVNSSTLDYPGILVGGLSGLGGALGPSCTASGCILGPSYYHNVGSEDTLTSKAVFGEVYYDLIPDTLKITGGLRLTNDDKFNTGRILLYSGIAPLGTTSESYFPNSQIPSLECNPSACPLIPVSQQFTAYTGRGVIDWTPQLDFTDQTLIYASYSTGYKAGGANPNIEPGLPVPQKYSPENIDSYELGTKNQLLGNSLQANGDIYYYNYKGLQVSEIEYNTSVNQNIAAHVWGAEGNFLWQATDRLQFGLNFAHEDSNIQNTALVDAANPTGGNQHTLLIKDDTISPYTGQNCVLYYSGAFPGLPAGFTAPAGGVHALAAYGIPNIAYGTCNPALLTAAAASAGYLTPEPNGPTDYEGQSISLDGHELQNTPQLSLGLSGQYVQPLASDYNLVARVDFHWQAHMWGDIFEDGASHIGSEEVTDASLQLNSPNDVWYAQAFIKNIFGANNITGEYVTSQTSGLYSNAFYGDPRTYGITLGAKLDQN